MNGKLAFSTDSFVVSPIFFPGGNIGSLAVHGTVNDVAMCGAIPKYISLSLIIEEGLKVEELWEILTGIKVACEEAEVIVITGDTKVVEKGKGDKIFINTTGIGEIMPESNLDSRCIKEGDKIIISGPIASHGTTILSEREGINFDSGISTDSAPLNHMVRTTISEFKEDIHFIRDATRGGVAAVLNEICKYSNLGIVIEQDLLPILPEVQNLCEILGLDPLYVANEGVAVFFVNSSVAEEVLSTIRKTKYGLNAKIVGEVTDTNPNKVIMKSGIGGTRVVHMPLAEQLPRIC
jgi:hydrogenase expression/formation protein HypE